MSSSRSLLRPVREVVLRNRQSSFARVQQRWASDEVKSTEVPETGSGPNENQLPHVTEEQAAMDKVMGNNPPDISQGTPVQEILQRDDEQDSAPEVMKKQMQNNQQKRSYSTSARRLTTAQDEVYASSSITPNGMIDFMSYPEAGPGHKFPLPDLNSLGSLNHLKRRYDPVVDQVTKSLMRDGKLSAAQKHMSEILTILRTAPPPSINPQFPARTLLLSDQGAPGSSASLIDPSTNPTEHNVVLPRATLPLHPVEYLTTIIDSVSPLIKIRQQRGIVGGGGSLPIPVPLGVRQRRRQAIQWILSAADNRRETRLSDRVARELLKVADGTSSVWEKRGAVNRMATTARSNIRRSGGRR